MIKIMATKNTSNGITLIVKISGLSIARVKQVYYKIKKLIDEKEDFFKISSKSSILQ